MLGRGQEELPDFDEEDTKNEETKDAEVRLRCGKNVEGSLMQDHLAKELFALWDSCSCRLQACTYDE